MLFHFLHFSHMSSIADTDQINLSFMVFSNLPGIEICFHCLSTFKYVV